MCSYHLGKRLRVLVKGTGFNVLGPITNEDNVVGQERDWGCRRFGIMPVGGGAIGSGVLGLSGKSAKRMICGSTGRVVFPLMWRDAGRGQGFGFFLAAVDRNGAGAAEDAVF